MSRWSAASIRVRLTGWYTVVLFLMMVVYATATFLAVRHEFLEQLDDQLHEDFETVEGFLAPAADGRIVWAGDRHHDPDYDEERGSDVWSASGEPIYRSTASAGLPPAAIAAATATPRYESVVTNRSHWRTLTRTSLVGGRAIVLRVSRRKIAFGHRFGKSWSCSYSACRWWSPWLASAATPWPAAR